MAIYKRGQEFELGTTENKSSKCQERDSNPGPAGLRVRRADYSATLSHVYQFMLMVFLLLYSFLQMYSFT